MTIRCQICERQGDSFYIVQLKNMQEFRLCPDCTNGRPDIVTCSKLQKDGPELPLEQRPKLFSIDLLQNNPYQPRTQMEESNLQQLAETMKSQGFQGVLVARPHPTSPGAYQLTAGHRRREAARRAGMTELPVIVQEHSEREMAALAATENIQREDLSPLEEGRLFQVMKDTLGQKLTEIAGAVKKDVGYVRNRLRLASAPEDIRAFVAMKADSLSTAFYLLDIEDPTERAPIIEMLLKKTLTIKDLPEYIEEMKRQQLMAEQSSVIEPLAQSPQTETPVQSQMMELPAQSSEVGLPVQSSTAESPEQPLEIMPFVQSQIVGLPVQLPETAPYAQSQATIEQSGQSPVSGPLSSGVKPASEVAPVMDDFVRHDVVRAEPPTQPSAVLALAAATPIPTQPAATKPAAPPQPSKSFAAAHLAAQERVRRGRLKRVITELKEYREMIPEQGQMSEQEGTLADQILAMVEDLPRARSTDVGADGVA